jgi:MYXO-CTERM domain-containing protein
MALGLMLAAARATAQTPVTTTAGTGATTSAQPSTNAFQISLTKAGGKPYLGTPLNPTLPINAQACNQGTIQVELLMLPAAYRYVQVWEAPMGGDCSGSGRSVSTSTSATSNACQQLRPPGTDSTGSTQITLPADQPIVVPIDDLCGAQGTIHFQGTIALYFLLLHGTSVTEAAGAFSVLNLTIATTPPDPATNVQGNSGETQINVSWTRAAQTAQYFVVIDPTAISTADLTIDAGLGDTICHSVELTEGMTLNLDDDNRVNLRPLVVQDEHYSSDGTTIDGESLNTPLAAFGVITKDVAGNYSNLSNVSCIKVVPTTGFWARYLANGGDAEQGCACSSVGSPRSRGPVGFLAGLAVFGLLAVRLRTRRRGQ